MFQEFYKLPQLCILSLWKDKVYHPSFLEERGSDSKWWSIDSNQTLECKSQLCYSPAARCWQVSSALWAWVSQRSNGNKCLNQKVGSPWKARRTGLARSKHSVRAMKLHARTSAPAKVLKVDLFQSIQLSVIHLIQCSLTEQLLRLSEAQVPKASSPPEPWRQFRRCQAWEQRLTLCTSIAADASVPRTYLYISCAN